VFCDDWDILETMGKSSSCQTVSMQVGRKCSWEMAASRSAKDILEMLVRSRLVSSAAAALCTRLWM
jgi:hypothetical protein